MKMLPQRSENILLLKKYGRVVKFNRFFLKSHKIVDHQQKFYLSKYCVK